MAFLCPEISKIKIQKKIYLRNLANYLLNITHFYDHIKFIFKLFYQDNISSCYYWHRLAPLPNFEIEKIQKRTTSTTRKFYVDLDPKGYLGPRDPIIGSMGYGGD